MQRITALILAITLLFTFGSTFVLADDAYEADSTLEESSASELPPENVVPKATISPDSELTSSPKSDDALSVSPEVSQESTPQPMADPVKLEYEVLSDYETGGLYLFPVPDGDEITQEYSEQHTAWDIAAAQGSAVVAAEEGTVSYVQVWDGTQDADGMMSYGNMVEIAHPDGNSTLYAHLSEINVQAGDEVVRGQRIGRVGATGNATGAHLHFEVMSETGRKEDPQPVLEYGTSLLLAAYDWNWVYGNLYHPNGTKTVSDWGVTREGIVQELTAHENDHYYLGTPYKGADWQSPNGDTSYNYGSAGLNCAGFVSYVLCKLGLNAGTANINTHNATPENSVQALMCANGSVTGGADWYASYKSRDLLAGASNYNSWIINGDLKTYVYKTKEEMLSDGKLVKGDMILMLPGSGSPSNRDTHIGFFWGDTPSEDKMWHSLLTS